MCYDIWLILRSKYRNGKTFVFVIFIINFVRYIYDIGVFCNLIIYIYIVIINYTLLWNLILNI